MATKEQYEIFKMMFDQEDKRYTNLIDRGKTFISLATLYSGFITFTIEKLHNNTLLSWSLFFGAVASMLLAFLLSILAIGIYRYEMINKPKDIIAISSAASRSASTRAKPTTCSFILLRHNRPGIEPRRTLRALDPINPPYLALTHAAS